MDLELDLNCVLAWYKQLYSCTICCIVVSDLLLLTTVVKTAIEWVCRAVSACLAVAQRAPRVTPTQVDWLSPPREDHRCWASAMHYRSLQGIMSQIKTFKASWSTELHYYKFIFLDQRADKYKIVIKQSRKPTIISFEKIKAECFPSKNA